MVWKLYECHDKNTDRVAPELSARGVVVAPVVRAPWEISPIPDMQVQVTKRYNFLIYTIMTIRYIYNEVVKA